MAPPSETETDCGRRPGSGAARQSGPLHLWLSCATFFKLFMPDTCETQGQSVTDLVSETHARDKSLARGPRGNSCGRLSGIDDSRAMYTNATWRLEGHPRGPNQSPPGQDMSCVDGMPGGDGFLDCTPTNRNVLELHAPVAASLKGVKCGPIEIKVPRREEEGEELDDGEDSPVGGLDPRKWDTGRCRREGWTLGEDREGEEEEEEEESDSGKQRALCDPDEGKRRGNSVEGTGRAIERIVGREQERGALLRAIVMARKVRGDDRAVEVMQVRMKTLITSS